MSKLRDALRKKFKTPREAILALGLDESLVTERAYDSNSLIKENTMKKAKLSALGTVAYGALTTFIRPQLAMDAKIDLARGLRGITAANFKAKRPVLAAWINGIVEGQLNPEIAQDGALDKMGLDAVLDMVEKAKDDFPDDLKKKDPKAEDEDMEDEDADMDADDEDMSDEDKAKEMAAKKAKDKKAKDAKKAKDMKPKAGAKDKKAKDADVNEEDEEHDPETPEETANDEDDEEANQAMDAKITAGIEAGIKKERLRMEAISDAKEHVRPRVGALSMAFDSASEVYRKALKIATGKEPPKDAPVSALKYAYDNLPAKDGGRRQTFAMDSAISADDDFATRNPKIAASLSRIGSA
jgi:hypothetical protein